MLLLRLPPLLSVKISATFGNPERFLESVAILWSAHNGIYGVSKLVRKDFRTQSNPTRKLLYSHQEPKAEKIGSFHKAKSMVGKLGNHLSDVGVLNHLVVQVSQKVWRQQRHMDKMSRRDHDF